MTANESNDVKKLYIQSLTQNWAGLEFEQKISTDKKLLEAFQHFEKNQTFDWTKCLADNNVFYEFFDLLMKNASPATLSHYMTFYSNINDYEFSDMIKEVMVEKYKMLTLNELQKELIIDDSNVPNLDELEVMSFLTISNTFDDINNENFLLGKLADFLRDNKDREVKIMSNYVEELFKDVGLTKSSFDCQNSSPTIYPIMLNNLNMGKRRTMGMISSLKKIVDSFVLSS